MEGSHVATDLESRSAQNKRQYDFRKVHENKIIIKSQSLPLYRDYGFELLPQNGDVLEPDLVQTQAHMKNRFLPCSLEKDAMPASKACDH